MRYCEKCGYVIDEFDSHRDRQNCPICSWIWSEDDMTAIKYAKLSESEKDAYDEQLLNLIKSNPNFDVSSHQNCSTRDGQWWGGFRVDKYAKYETEERIVKSLLERRKANEPFKPFPQIDNVKAREVALNAELTHKAIERGCYSSKSSNQQVNVPKCPTCQSTNIEKISLGKKAVGGALFGLFSSDVRKTMNCKSSGVKWQIRQTNILSVTN